MKHLQISLSFISLYGKTENTATFLGTWKHSHIKLILFITLLFLSAEDGSVFQWDEEDS